MDFKTKPTTDFDPIERLDEAQAAAAAKALPAAVAAQTPPSTEPEPSS